MYNDVGKKLKKIAKITCSLGTLISIIATLVIIIGTIRMDNTYESYAGASASNGGGIIAGLASGIPVAIIGIIASWLGSILTYAFGELVDKTASTYETNCKILKALEKRQQPQEQVNATADFGNADVAPESSTSAAVRRRRQLPPI